MENKIDSYPSSLSGGQKQRVSIARALANKPEILLCDEATSALDLETTEGILSLLQRINRELGITIVFITHQLDVAKQIFDRVAVMENGVVVEQGNTFDVFSTPKHPTTKALVERYLGVGGPAQRQLAQVARADHQTALHVGDVHQYLRALAGLTVFIGRRAVFGIESDVAEVLRAGVADRNFADRDAQPAPLKAHCPLP